MSRTVHLIAKNVSGYGPPDGRCVPCSGLSGKAITATSRLSHGDCIIRPQVKIGPLSWVPRAAPFVCEASSSDIFEDDDEELELGYSESGSLLSISNTPGYQSTATKEEIFEMLSKIRIKLRERAAKKEGEKYGEAPEEKSKLNKLRGKHVAEEGKSSNGGRIRGIVGKDMSAINGGFSNGMASHGSSFKSPSKSPVPRENRNDGSSIVSQWMASEVGKKYLASISAKPGEPGIKSDSKLGSADDATLRSLGPRKKKNMADVSAELEEEPEIKSDSKLGSGGDATFKSIWTSSGSWKKKKKNNLANISAELEEEPYMKSDSKLRSSDNATMKPLWTSSGSRKKKKNLADVSAELEEEPKMKPDLEFGSGGDATMKSRPTSSEPRKMMLADIVAQLEEEPEMETHSEYGDDATVKSLWTSSGSWKNNLADVLAELEDESDLEFELESESEFDPEPEAEPAFELDSESDSEFDLEPEHENKAKAVFSDKDGKTSEELTEEVNLKVTELRALAKTRGLKRTSKMKKSELIDLLSKI